MAHNKFKKAIKSNDLTAFFIFISISLKVSSVAKLFDG